jgi:hypothetical protein
MLTVRSCATITWCLWAGMAQAMPGSMPWDHAGGPGRPDCTACHFDAAAVSPSPALRLTGLPERAVSGTSYDLVLRLGTENLETAGFLISADARGPAGERLSAGTFTPANGRTEAGESAIRSTVAGARQTEPGAAEWRFSWQSPGGFSGMVTIYAAGIAANDDQSPLGDQVHLLQISIPVDPKSG